MLQTRLLRDLEARFDGRLDIVTGAASARRRLIRLPREDHLEGSVCRLIPHDKALFILGRVEHLLDHLVQRKLQALYLLCLLTALFDRLYLCLNALVDCEARADLGRSLKPETAAVEEALHGVLGLFAHQKPRLDLLHQVRLGDRQLVKHT